ncbi:MAG: hypothetical protein R2706_03890 [Acidimicrobiales bacterium]
MLGDDGITRGESFPAEYIYVDGSVGDLDHSVVVERRTLGTDGFVSAVVALVIKGANAELVGLPQIVSRGWVDGPEGDQLRKDAASQSVRDAVEKAIADGVRSRASSRRSLVARLGVCQ